MVAYMMMSSHPKDTEGWMEWDSLKPPPLSALRNLTFRHQRTGMTLPCIDETASRTDTVASITDDESLLYH